MKYIESLELREWVKDNLKKTIFQKAHALAVQTGCQILVKLEDDYDTTKHQYYATDKLRKVFKHNGLRQQPEEKFVSGVTGEPLIDQAIQSDGTGQIGELIGNLVDQGQRLGPESEVRSQGSGPEERLLDTDNVAGDEETAIPMQLSMSAESFQSDVADDRTKETETTGNDISTDVKIKIEQMDDDPGGGSGDGGGSGVDHDTSSTSMFGYDPNVTSRSDSSSQFQSAPQAAPIVQHPSSYQVPMSPKPYQCAMCGKAFRSVQVLQKHTQTFHMKTQHVMMGVRTGRGRGRGRPGFRFGAAQQQSQTSSFTCVMCNINFPEADILQDHMTRTHMGGATPQPQGSPADPNFSAPGTSQQSAVPSFSIPHTQSSPGGATPAASQGSPFSPQGTPSSTPIFPRNVSSPGSKPSTSAGTTRMSSKPKPQPTLTNALTEIQTAILLTAGPINTITTFGKTVVSKLRKTKKINYLKAGQELEKLGIIKILTTKWGGCVIVKMPPKDVCTIIKDTGLCSPHQYEARYKSPLPKSVPENIKNFVVAEGYEF